MPTNPILAAKDPEVLLNRIRKEFPDVTWREYKFIDVGWDHEIIQLDNQYIFRFPNSHEYLPILRDEIELLKYVSDHTKARIPRYTHVAKDISFAGYDMLPGEPLNSDLFSSLNDDQRESAAKSIASFLTDFHSINIDDLARFNIGSEKPFGGYDDSEALAIEYLQPNLPEDEYAVIARMLTDIAQAQKYPQPARLTHGDIAPKHLLWDEKDQQIGFIDFSDRSISDPAADFAELYTYGEPFAEQVYEFYKSPDKDSHFLDRAKGYMKAVGVHQLVNSYRTDKVTRDVAMDIVQIGAKLNID